jgi:acyl-CoA thioesterase-1
MLAAEPAIAAEVVALGASNTYGNGVARGDDYPSQLQTMLRAKGLNVTVVNAGIGGDTSLGMLGRFDSAVDASTRVVILETSPNNDARNGIAPAESKTNNDKIAAAAAERKIKLIVIPVALKMSFPRQADNLHLTPEGYRGLAAALLPRVTAALRK